MNWNDVAASVTRATVAAFAETSPATYTHSAGGTASITVAFHESLEVPDPGGQYLERTRAVELSRDDLTKTPVPGDTVAVRGVTWRVQRVLFDDGFLVRLAVA